MKIEITLEECNKIRSALEFYSNQEFIYCLSRPRQQLGCKTWEEAYKLLGERGFVFEAETYDSSELFVEDGSKARNALEIVDKIESENENIQR